MEIKEYVDALQPYLYMNLGGYIRGLVAGTIGGFVIPTDAYQDLTVKDMFKYNILSGTIFGEAPYDALCAIPFSFRPSDGLKVFYDDLGAILGFATGLTISGSIKRGCRQLFTRKLSKSKRRKLSHLSDEDRINAFYEELDKVFR